eukprot:s884_g6.t1
MHLGCISGGQVFNIERGVRQGDVISPLLFNAGLEYAVRKWKRTFGNHGLQIGAVERLTNIRYADDIMIYAKSMEEFVNMLELLLPERASVGIELNALKTKILTNENLKKPCFAEVAGEIIEILYGENQHKYLGKMLTGDMTLRTNVEFEHRLHAAWANFQKYKQIILNKHVSLKLRLNFFDHVVSPTAMFGIATLPLTKVQIQKLDVVQRRMLRSIVGWGRMTDESWQDTMRRMNSRLDFAVTLHPVRKWLERFFSASFTANTLEQRYYSDFLPVISMHSKSKHP